VDQRDGFRGLLGDGVRGIAPSPSTITTRDASP
jgi:hypothetical protein